ncbi:MAG: hypothetical protein Q4G07_02970 [Oscillospiraceae bacterium]|nr:hypothetical protein [Oscillospiraceae bacterium]
MKLKRFAEIVMQIKTIACFLFTAMSLIFVLTGLLLGRTTFSIWFIPQAALLSFLFAVLYFICFSNLIFKKLSYIRRLWVMAGPFFLLQTLCVWLFHWFDFSDVQALGIYFGIFLLGILGCLLAFYIYYRVAGLRYDGLLAAYRASHPSKS